PLTAEPPLLVTVKVDVNPVFHAFMSSRTAHPPGGGGGLPVVVVVVLLVVVEVVVPSESVGVVQSLQSARLPAFRLEIRNTPVEVPVFSRNFWRFCCNGVRHSGRTAQC